MNGQRIETVKKGKIAGETEGKGGRERETLSESDESH